VDSRLRWANNFSIWLLSSMTLMAGPGSRAIAQSTGADAGLEEIVVTAEKRAENVQRVPLSIVAISGEAMKASGVETPRDLPKLVPSLQISSTAYGSDVNIRIRGFGSPGNTAVDSDVASYIDGAFIPRPGALMSSMLDVKNVEVLSGPQGTLFGRNAAMGAISINTNAPSPKESFDASMEGGNYGTYKVTGIGNVPVNDQFAVRVAMQGSHTDGIYHNNLDGKTYGENTGYVGRGSAKWNITPDVSWNLRVDGTKSDGDGVNGAAVYTSTASPAQLAAMTTFIGRFGGTPPVYSNTPSYRFNQFVGSPFLHDHQVGVTSDLSWDLSHALTLRLIDTYRDWHDDQESPDSIATSLNLVSVRITTSSMAQSHELQLVSARDAYLGGRLGFTSGLYYFRENYSLDQSFNLGSQFCGLVYGRAAPRLVAPCLAGPQSNAGYDLLNQLATSAAGYFQVNYALLPNLDLDLGVRETSDRKTAGLDQVARNPLGIAPFIAPEGPDALSFRDSKPSFRASLSWHLTDSLMAFGTYSTGYKSGGFNAAFSTTNLGAAKRTFKSETVADYEFGLKSQMLDGKLILNATVFDTVLHNFQDRSYDGVEFLVRNAGAVTSRGLDLDGRFRALSKLTFNYGLTYLDSVYTRDIGAPGLEGCTGAVGGCSIVQNLSGRPLDYAPKFHGNVGLNWNFGEFRGYTTSFNAGESFTSSFLTANTDNPQSRLPSYKTTDLSFGLHSPDDRWELDIFGSNVFDEHYYTATIAQPLASVMGATNTTTGATVYRGFLGDPARFGARVAVHF
ncbi:MAG: TonB-dependent receptor, partial [Pseudomonadota bacterium]|nr:TonB-dependent receptor [Pseudomonadota bacterium]